MKNIEPQLKKSFLAAIKNSLGTKIFQTYYAKVNGKTKDVTEKGKLSCAYFASSITTIFNLTKSVHRTVPTTEQDLLDSGWYEIPKPKIGAIIIWDKEITDKGNHKHIGFYIGNNQAISNSSIKKFPVIHPWKFEGKRKVQKTLWHDKLN